MKQSVSTPRVKAVKRPRRIVPELDETELFALSIKSVMSEMSERIRI